MAPDLLLEVQEISKHYGGVTALDRVSINVHAGEVVALVGDNGAGKSTTIKVLSGALKPDGGSILVKGQQVDLVDSQDAVDRGIATVYQDLALCDNLDPIQNLFLGQERRRRFPPRLKRAEMERYALKAFNEVGLPLPKSFRSPVAELSGGQRQAVAISRVLLRSPDIVLLDEPTAALGVAQRGHVFDLVTKLRAQGRGLILISHDLSDVQRLADTIVVLRLGRVVANFQRSAYSTHDLVAAITGANEFVQESA